MHCPSQGYSRIEMEALAIGMVEKYKLWFAIFAILFRSHASAACQHHFFKIIRDALIL